MTTPDQPHAQTQEALPKRPQVGALVNLIGDQFSRSVKVVEHTKRGFKYSGAVPLSIPRMGILGTGEGEHFCDTIVGPGWEYSAEQIEEFTARAALCDELAEALKRIRPVPENILRKIPVRDLDETLSECDYVLKKHAALAHEREPLGGRSAQEVINIIKEVLVNHQKFSGEGHPNYIDAKGVRLLEALLAPRKET